MGFGSASGQNRPNKGRRVQRFFVPVPRLPPHCRVYCERRPATGVLLKAWAEKIWVSLASFIGGMKLGFAFDAFINFDNLDGYFQLSGGLGAFLVVSFFILLVERSSVDD